MQREIGDYVLCEQVGYGALGKTYLAQHRYLQTSFALKVLPEELSRNAEFIKRFQEQVARLAKVQSPYLVPIHSAFHSADLFVVVSPWISSALGTSHLKLSEEQVMLLTGQLCHALSAAHAQGMVHGALKFSNVIVTNHNQEYQAFISDLGVAEMLPAASLLGRVYHYVAQELEQQGELTNNFDEYQPAYDASLGLRALQRSFCERFLFLAPEQKQIQERPIGPAADLYALGVLVYYWLMGEFPEGRFPLPSQKNPSFYYQWDEWLCSLLHPDPQARPTHLLSTFEEWVVQKRKPSGAQALQELKTLGHRQPLDSGVGKPLLKPQSLTRPTFDADPAAVFQIDTAIAPYKPEPKEEKEIAPLQTQMVVIPQGHYLRGSNQGGRDEMPRHEIHLNAFAIDVHPVTNEQFVLFLEAMGGEKDAHNSEMIRLKDSRIKRSGGKLSIESGYALHPVVGVTWYGAVAYAQWVGKRLPTEAEWEVAAYGGRQEKVYPTGDYLEKADANFFSSDTTAVMSYPANPVGLFDMAGNVYEWCQDWYDHHFYDLSVQEPNDPKGPAQGIYRVLRGGCWKSSKEDLRCAHRHRNNPGSMNGTYGFRCAADVTFDGS